MRVLITALGLCVFSFLAGVAGDLSMSAEAAPQAGRAPHVVVAHAAVPSAPTALVAAAPQIAARIAPCSVAVSVLPEIDLLAEPAVLALNSAEITLETAKFGKRPA